MAITGGQIFDGVSLAADVTSTEVDMRERLSVGIRLESAIGTRAGTIAIEGKIGGGAWDEISFFDNTGTIVSSITVSAGSALDATIQLGGPLNYDLLRVAFADGTGGAGVGTIDGWVDRGFTG